MKPTPPRIAEHPPKTAISLSDLKKLDRACDEFFRRRGTYVEYPQANHFSWVDWSSSAPWTLTFLQLHLRPEV